MLDALHEDALFARKKAEEAALRKSAGRELGIGDPWGDIEKALAAQRAIYLPYVYIEAGGGFQGRLVGYARTLVRGAAERDRPNDQRFREYTDGSLPRIEQQLGAQRARSTPSSRRCASASSLERMREWLGPDHPIVRKLLAKEASERARQAARDRDPKLGDPAVRLELWKGGSAAIAASTDPMIVLARTIEPDARALRKQYEDTRRGAGRARRARRSRRRASPRSAPASIRTPRSRCASTAARCRAGTRTASRSSRSRSCRARSSAPPARIRSASRTAGRR